MEHILKEILERRAYRAFDEKKVPEGIISWIMTAALLYNNMSKEKS